MLLLCGMPGMAWYKAFSNRFRAAKSWKSVLLHLVQSFSFQSNSLFKANVVSPWRLAPVPANYEGPKHHANHETAKNGPQSPLDDLKPPPTLLPSHSGMFWDWFAFVGDLCFCDLSCNWGSMTFLSCFLALYLEERDSCHLFWNDPSLRRKLFVFRWQKTW